MKKQSTKHIIFSGIIGVIFWFLGELWYESLTKQIWQPLGIALYFCIFAVIMVIGMYLLAIFRGDYNLAVNKGIKPLQDNIGSILILLIIFFIATGLFEFLYELGGKAIDNQPTSYVFVIDDSGSMAGNDPNCERATAISKIMEKQDAGFPYAVYSFTSGSQKLKGIGPYSPSDSYQFNSDGGTNIIGALTSVLDEIIGSTHYGTRPRIMLVSDGSSSSFGAGEVIDKCNDHGISISSISFGSFFGNSLLKRLSGKTGGVYVDVQNVDDLYNEMQIAITSNATRNLVSERHVLKLNWMYAIMRILFLFIMAALWSLIKDIAYCGIKRTKGEEHYSYDNVVGFTMLCAVISILIMEFGTALAIPGSLARLILAILWTMIPGRFYVASNEKAQLTNVPYGTSLWGNGMNENSIYGQNGNSDDNNKFIGSNNGFESTDDFQETRVDAHDGFDSFSGAEEDSGMDGSFSSADSNDFGDFGGNNNDSNSGF